MRHKTNRDCSHLAYSEQNELNMDRNMDVVVRRILFVTLFIYFLMKLYESVIKLDSEVSQFSQMINTKFWNIFFLFNELTKIFYFS